MLQPHQARLLKIFINSYTIWYSQPRGNSLSSTDQSQCLLSSSSAQQSILVSSSDYHVIPPPTPYHHVIYYVTPTSQSGSSMLPINVFPLLQATLTFLVPGRRNASRSMSH
ncbi:hypothetical protein TNCV_4721781 [Trichonephila clavipes]|uniref:Uncharacterized protein n=1 Tax=Trichonephila clavipes TaxID=2585209 RepID=A0A8X6W6L0_TRICX|nr:hypothetical protein TNCV_4721781 [Trichonephila clavipes]